MKKFLLLSLSFIFSLSIFGQTTVLDFEDAANAKSITEAGTKVSIEQTMMSSLIRKKELAKATLNFAQQLTTRSRSTNSNSVVIEK